MMILFQLAQEAAPPSGWSDLIATYGPFAPFAALLLYLGNLLWKDNKAKEAEIRRLSETAMERVLPLVLEATKVLAEAVDALNQSKDTQKELYRLSELIRELIAALDEAMRVLKPAVQARKRAT